MVGCLLVFAGGGDPVGVVTGGNHGQLNAGGTVNLSNPRAIFAGSPPRFTRSRVTYEAYAVSRTSTPPQVDSAPLTAPRRTTISWFTYSTGINSASVHTKPMP